MITAALLLFSASTFSIVDSSEFFPTTPGTKWVYSEESMFGSGSYTDEVLAPVDLGDGKVVPIERKYEGKTVDTVYYRLTPDSVAVAAYDLKKPLETPRIVLKIGKGPQKWDFSGLSGDVPYTTASVATLKGKKNILGQEVECLEVRMEAKLGPAGQKPLVSKQTSLYAKGIGLVEMQEKLVSGRNTEEKKVKLVSFSPGRL